LKLPEEILILLLALFGGIARYLDTYLKGIETFSISRMVATIVVCSFSGYMCSMFVNFFYPTWIYVSAGIGGYAGVEALNFIINFWKNKLTNGQGQNK